MKFTKKMVEVIERQIGRKLTADEIERGAVKETGKRRPALRRWKKNFAVG